MSVEKSSTYTPTDEDMGLEYHLAYLLFMITVVDDREHKRKLWAQFAATKAKRSAPMVERLEREQGLRPPPATGDR